MWVWIGVDVSVNMNVNVSKDVSENMGVRVNVGVRVLSIVVDVVGGRNWSRIVGGCCICSMSAIILKIFNKISIKKGLMFVCR